jgi:hypothetical protein
MSNGVLFRKSFLLPFALLLTAFTLISCTSHSSSNNNANANSQTPINEIVDTSNLTPAYFGNRYDGEKMARAVENVVRRYPMRYTSINYSISEHNTRQNFVLDAVYAYYQPK